jgi:hypothetical protein
MANTHILPDVAAEVQAQFGDLLAPAILSSSLTVPGSGLTLPAFATYGYVRNGSPTRLCYVNQAAAPVTIAGGTGAYWLALMHDTHSAIAGWTRQPGTHYAWCAAGTQPADPAGGLVMAGVTVAGGSITATDLTPNIPQTKVAFGGPSGALAFDRTFTFNTTTKAVDARQFHVPNVAGDNAVGFHSHLVAAGGTNRWHLFGSGDAPSYLGGGLTVQGAGTVNGALSWAGAATGIMLRLGDQVYPGYTLDVNGDMMCRGHTGLGAVPLPGQFHLNCGFANFTSVTTAALTAGGTSLGPTSITGTLAVTGITNVVCAPQPGYHFSAQSIYSVGDASVNALTLRGASGGYALYSPSAGQVHFGGFVGIYYGVDAGYWLRVPSIYVDTLRATTANVDGNVNVGGNVAATGNVYGTIGAFGIGPQPGYYLSTSNLYCSATMQVAGAAQFLDKLAVKRAPEAGYWFTAENAYLGQAAVGLDFTMSGPAHCANRLTVHRAQQAGFWLTAETAYFNTAQVGGNILVVSVTATDNGYKPGGGPWADSSYRHLKRNIQAIDDPLGLLLAQRGRCYEWDEETRAQLLPGPRYGLIEDEVTLPQWRVPQEDGQVAIAANGFEALCIEALRQIVQRLEALEGQN